MVTSSNMNLPISTIGVDSGLSWELNLNSALTIIDAHNHTPGYGSPILPSGININSDLTFNNYSATNLKSVSLTPQASLATTLSLYTIGADLYFNDGNSNIVRITTSGGINATSSGITSGTASASFVSSVLTVLSAATTPANIQCASILLGNNSAGTKYLTLEPPAAMGSNYTLTLPSIPAATNIMTLDTSGNMSAPLNVDNSTIEISSNNLQVKDNGIVTSKILNANITRAKLSAVGQQVSSSCGNFTTANTSFTNITNLSVSITTTGRPVFARIICDGSSNSAFYGCGGGASGNIRILLDGSSIGVYDVVSFGSGSFEFYSSPGAGSHTYTAQLIGPGGQTVQLAYYILLVYEL